MKYFIFECNIESQELCEIITAFGKYKYKCLHMGLKFAPDFTQPIMEKVLHRFNDVEVYLDNINIFRNT